MYVLLYKKEVVGNASPLAHRRPSEYPRVTFKDKVGAKAKPFDWATRSHKHYRLVHDQTCSRCPPGKSLQIFVANFSCTWILFEQALDGCCEQCKHADAAIIKSLTPFLKNALVQQTLHLIPWAKEIILQAHP